MAGALYSLVEAMDRCWIERRSDDLSALLALTSSLSHVMARLALPVFRQRSRSIVPSWYEPRSRGSHRAIMLSPSAAPPTFSMGQVLAVRGRRARGDRRKILVLAGRDGARRTVWRTQLPGEVERPGETVRRRLRLRGVVLQDKAGAALFGKAPVCT